MFAIFDYLTKVSETDKFINKLIKKLEDRPTEMKVIVSDTTPTCYSNNSITVGIDNKLIGETINRLNKCKKDSDCSYDGVDTIRIPREPKDWVCGNLNVKYDKDNIKTSEWGRRSCVSRYNVNSEIYYD